MNRAVAHKKREPPTSLRHLLAAQRTCPLTALACSFFFFSLLKRNLSYDTILQICGESCCNAQESARLVVVLQGRAGPAVLWSHRRVALIGNQDEV